MEIKWQPTKSLLYFSFQREYFFFTFHEKRELPHRFAHERKGYSLPRTVIYLRKENFNDLNILFSAILGVNMCAFLRNTVGLTEI